MKVNANTILWIALVVLAILYLRSCDKDSGNSLYEDPVVITKTDTLYKKGKSDTVFLVDTLVKYKYLSSTIVDVVHDTILGDTIRTYNTEVDDTLLTATIVSKVQGKLLNTSLSYSPKFPKYITRVDTFQINDSTTVTIKKNPWSLYFGGVVAGNANTFEVVPTLMLKTNKSLQFSVGYGLINKTYNVGVFTKIPNPFK